MAFQPAVTLAAVGHGVLGPRISSDERPVRYPCTLNVVRSPLCTFPSMRYSRCSASRHPLWNLRKLHWSLNEIISCWKKLPPSVSMPKVCPSQQGDTAACTLVKRLVSQLLTSHSVRNLGHNFCKYCRAYTTANINWTVDSTQQHPCRCSECNFAERPQLSISGDSLELSAYLARSRLGLISIRCLRVRTATISDPPNCTCTLVLYLMPLTISWQFCYF